MSAVAAGSPGGPRATMAQHVPWDRAWVLHPLDRAWALHPWNRVSALRPSGRALALHPSDRAWVQHPLDRAWVQRLSGRAWVPCPLDRAWAPHPLDRAHATAARHACVRPDLYPCPARATHPADRARRAGRVLGLTAPRVRSTHSQQRESAAKVAAADGGATRGRGDRVGEDHARAVAAEGAYLGHLVHPAAGDPSEVEAMGANLLQTAALVVAATTLHRGHPEEEGASSWARSDA